jgi:hypothetical protein
MCDMSLIGMLVMVLLLWKWPISWQLWHLYDVEALMAPPAHRGTAIVVVDMEGQRAPPPRSPPHESPRHAWLYQPVAIESLRHQPDQ